MNNETFFGSKEVGLRSVGAPELSAEARHPKMHPPKLYPGPTIQARSAAQRAAQDLVKFKKWEKTKPGLARV